MRLTASVIALLLASCVSHHPRFRSNHTASCEAVCDHYTDCRGTDDQNIYGACVRECREIFYEDGVADERSLREFQNLACPDAVGFVEGDSGRPPGARETGPLGQRAL